MSSTRYWLVGLLQDDHRLQRWVVPPRRTWPGGRRAGEDQMPHFGLDRSENAQKALPQRAFLRGEEVTKQSQVKRLFLSLVHAG